MVGVLTVPFKGSENMFRSGYSLTDSHSMTNTDLFFSYTSLKTFGPTAGELLTPWPSSFQPYPKDVTCRQIGSRLPTWHTAEIGPTAIADISFPPPILSASHNVLSALLRRQHARGCA